MNRLTKTQAGQQLKAWSIEQARSRSAHHFVATMLRHNVNVKGLAGGAGRAGGFGAVRYPWNQLLDSAFSRLRPLGPRPSRSASETVETGAGDRICAQAIAKAEGLKGLKGEGASKADHRSVCDRCGRTWDVNLVTATCRTCASVACSK